MPWCIVLKNWHPMVGVDFHTQVPPPPAPPIPNMPYYTGSAMFGTTMGTTTQKYFPTHPSSGFGLTMARATDIGPIIGHFGPLPHILLPLEIMLSASKSYFGASSYLGKDNTGGVSPVCTCALVIVNLNVNCGTPLNTPTGVVPGINTHVAHMSLADYAVAIIQAAVEVALSYLLNKYMPVLTRNLFPQSVRTALMARLASSPMFARVLTQLIGGKADDLAVHVFTGNMMNAMVGLIIGSPFGISIANTPVGVAPYTPVDVGIGKAAGAAQGLPDDAPDAPPPLPTFGTAGDEPGDYPIPGGDTRPA
jgi:hypothetical protein